ncbi:MAG: hypothetical protein KAS32_17120 [Candidatus Peribacteraceae bacterium]|nr:hypothetical protein [Candidatus Peribacteraceae bacterium]
MSTRDNNLIDLFRSLEGSPHIERPATEEITPGQLLEDVAAGVKRHTKTSGPFEPIFALANWQYYGKDIDDVYASGDVVMIRSFRAGDLVYAWYKGGASIAYGDYMVSAGDGTLEEYTNAYDPVVGVCLETHASDPGLIRLKIRIT